MKKRILALSLMLVLLLSSSFMFAQASDISNHWAKDTIKEWQAKGYIKGYEDGTFRPDKDITEKEFVLLLTRSLNLKDFKEVGKDYAITRGEAAVLIAKAANLSGGGSLKFIDSNITSEQKDAISAVAAKNYMNGYPDGSFRAYKTLTRAEAVIVLNRIISKPAITRDDIVKNGVFVDSAGRSVKLPDKITKIAPSGKVAEIVLYATCPEKMVGWGSKPAKSIQKYFDPKALNLPEFGQFYGKSVTLNMEALVLAKPDVIIDLGQKKKTIAEDMDMIQKQTGIPVIFIEAELKDMPVAFETLGVLVGNDEVGRKLAKYSEDTLKLAAENSKRVPADKKVKVYYGEGKSGLQTNAAGSIHADLIETVGGVNVVAQNAINASTSEISMEQLKLLKPDVIMFGPDSVYSGVAKDKIWSELDAVKSGKYYEVPFGPYNFVGRPPSINKLLGIKWLGSILYPEIYNIDMIRETKEFYNLFYRYDLSDAEARELLQNSTMKITR